MMPSYQPTSPKRQKKAVILLRTNRRSWPNNAEVAEKTTELLEGDDDCGGWDVMVVYADESWKSMKRQVCLGYDHSNSGGGGSSSSSSSSSSNSSSSSSSSRVKPPNDMTRVCIHHQSIN